MGETYKVWETLRNPQFQPGSTYVENYHVKNRWETTGQTGENERISCIENKWTIAGEHVWQKREHNTESLISTKKKTKDKCANKNTTENTEHDRKIDLKKQSEDIVLHQKRSFIISGQPRCQLVKNARSKEHL